MDYSQWVTTVADLLDISATITNAASATPSTDPNFNNIIPSAIFTAESRIQRDLDLINTYVSDTTGALKANSRSFSFPTDTGTFVVVTQVSIFVGGVRQPPLLPMSWEAVNSFYPSEASLTPAPSIPVYWSPTVGTGGIVGPAPDQAYPIEVVGTQRFTPLSSTNTTNFLTLQLPDIYIAASMKYLFESYQRDGGMGSDDATQPAAWDKNYQELMRPSLVEEARKKFMSMGWNARLPSPIASPVQT